MESTTRPSNARRPLVWSDQLLDDATHDRIRIERAGRTVPYRLTNLRRERFEEAKKRGYVIRWENVADDALENVWSTWCEMRQWPDVKVVNAAPYAIVRLDLMAMPYKLNQEYQEQLKRSVDRLISPFVKHDCLVDGTHVYASKIPMHYASSAADAMLAFGLRAKEDATGERQWMPDPGEQHPGS